MRWQFSLRTTLAATVAAGLCFAWWTGTSSRYYDVVYDDLPYDGPIFDVTYGRWLTEVHDQAGLDHQQADPVLLKSLLSSDFDSEYYVVLEGLTPVSEDPYEYVESTRLHGRVMFLEVQQSFHAEDSSTSQTAHFRGITAPYRSRIWIPVPKGTSVWLVTPGQMWGLDITVAMLILALFLGLAFIGRVRGVQVRR